MLIESVTNIYKTLSFPTSRTEGVEGQGERGREKEREKEEMGWEKGRGKKIIE